MAKQIYPVGEDTTLMEFLISTLKDKSRTTVKSYLAHRQVEVNRQTTSQFNAPLKKGDSVTLWLEKRSEELRHPMLDIVFEDEYLIVVNKKSGLLSMGTDREREKTALFILSQYVKQADTKNMIFILHRLDRDTSGLMMFAKDEKIKHQMQNSWNETVTDRRYVAVVEGKLDRKEGIISTFLTDTKGFKVFVSTKNEGQRAVTSFKVMKEGRDYSLLELSLTTGRKNQIRAHMEHIGHSIAGDKKYGAKSNPIGRVALHAMSLSFIHPVTGEELSFSTVVPGKFLSLV